MTKILPITVGNRNCVLVTGASRGIGRAIAYEMGKVYDDVILVARSEQILNEVSAELKEVTSTVRVFPADITVPKHIDRLVNFIRDNCGRLDVLIHAAGVYEEGLTQKNCRYDLMAVNYSGPAEITARLLPFLKASGGQIVFINSTQGLHAGPNKGAYAASKFALHAFADSLRSEVNVDGVRVLSIFLGATATAIQEHIHRRTKKPYRPEQLMQPSDVASMVASALQLPKTSEVVEMTLRPMQPSTASL